MVSKIRLNDNRWAMMIVRIEKIGNVLRRHIFNNRDKKVDHHLRKVNFVNQFDLLLR